MTAINLLPWREMKRAQEKKKLTALFLGGAVFAMVSVLLINHYMSSCVCKEALRNKKLQEAITPYDAQILAVLDPKRKRQPLEMFLLDSLKFVGILQESSKIWGLMRRPDGVIAPVKLGDRLGQHFGKVMQINRESLTVEEIIQVKGKWKKKITDLSLNLQ